ECTSTSLDDEDHLVITIDVLTESILADPRRSGRLSGSSGLEGPRSTHLGRSALELGTSGMQHLQSLEMAQNPAANDRW
ncbi:MAG: hypothetical protein O7D29_03155, partial [Gemmatimonadetes bacterium]|nr:hypothetical protein [Gemmatimonadota bacterium]